MCLGLVVGSVVGAVLAGGKGSRFWPFSDLVPKPLVPVGDLEKPVLEYIVSWLAKNGVDRIGLLVGYRYRQIQNYFGDGSRWGVRLGYSVDDPYDPEPLVGDPVNGYKGTGGALLKAVRRGVLPGDHIVVWYGDIIADVDVRGLITAHLGSGAVATIVVARDYRVPVGVPVLDGDRVVELREKPWLGVKPTIGVLVVERSGLLGAEEELGRGFDIMGDLIPYFIRGGLLVKAFVHGGHWYDVGSIERYQKIPSEILGVLNRMIDS